MNTHYAIELKRKICQDICLNGKSTMKTANENVDFKFVNSFGDNSSYEDMSVEDLKKNLMKKDIEIARLKKGYLVKEGGMGEKVFVTFSKKNTK